MQSQTSLKKVRLALPTKSVSFLAFYVLLIGFVNLDAGRRGMSRTLWTLVAALVPYGIGALICAAAAVSAVMNSVDATPTPTRPVRARRPVIASRTVYDSAWLIGADCIPVIQRPRTSRY